jgi:hypothetical protein
MNYIYVIILLHELQFTEHQQIHSTLKTITDERYDACLTSVKRRETVQQRNSVAWG